MQVNRRDFIGMAASGAGAIVATSALPALGKDDPSLFPKRGVVERLAIAYQHIHIGLPQPTPALGTRKGRQIASLSLHPSPGSNRWFGLILVRHSERAPCGRLAASGRSHPPGSPQYVFSL